MIRAYIAKSETSPDKVHQILETIDDLQEIHYEKQIMPGMGFFYLVARHIKKPILKVNLEFKGLRLYPLEFKCNITEEPGITILSLEDNIGQIGEFKVYNRSSGDNQDKINNQDKIKKVYKIGGKLLESFKGHEAIANAQAVLYYSQSLKFTEEDTTPYDRLKFEAPEMIDKRDALIKEAYFNPNNKITGQGESRVKIITKDILEYMINKAKKQQA